MINDNNAVKDSTDGAIGLMKHSVTARQLIARMIGKFEMLQAQLLLLTTCIVNTIMQSKTMHPW